MLASQSEGGTVDVQTIVEANLITATIAYLEHSASPKIQREAAWIVNYMTYSQDPEHVRIVVDSGATPNLLALISAADPILQEVVIHRCSYLIFRPLWL